MNIQELEKAIVRFVLPYARKFISDAANELEDEDRILEAVRSINAEQGSLPHPAMWIFNYIVQLMRPDAPDEDWREGHKLCKEWLANTSLIVRTRGRPFSKLDRYLIFAYLERSVQILNQSPLEAIERAAKVFSVPYDTLHRWYILKHEYSNERRPIKEIVGHLEVFYNGSEQELEEYFVALIESVAKDPNEIHLE